MTDETALEERPTEDPPETVDSAPVEIASAVAGRTVLALWLPTPSRRRLIDADLELVDDVADGPSLILVSTRGPATRRSSVATLTGSAPVVVVCHPGGESIAAEMVALGASAVVGEGSEVSALRVVDDEPTSHLLDAYLNEVDSGSSRLHASSVDPVTGLSALGGFERRLAELGGDGVMPRLGLVDLGLDHVLGQMGRSGHAAVKRRLAVAVAGAAADRGVEVFDLGSMLALLGAALPSDGSVVLAAEIVAIGSTFTPNGRPLEVAVGWAGPEVASDGTMLRVLAERALDAARLREARVVDAEELVRHSAGSIELAAVFEVARSVDAFDTRGDHSIRIADYAAELAKGLQLEPSEVATIALAARLHDVGKVYYGSDAFEPGSDRFQEATDLHPERGERFVVSNAGRGVAAIVRGHHERWDGTGFPDATTGEDIPMGARILAVVHRYDELAESAIPRTEIEQALRTDAGQSLDPDLVDAAIALFLRG
jgi:hypothetical protein